MGGARPRPLAVCGARPQPRPPAAQRAERRPWRDGSTPLLRGRRRSALPRAPVGAAVVRDQAARIWGRGKAPGGAASARAARPCYSTEAGGSVEGARRGAADGRHGEDGWRGSDLRGSWAVSWSVAVRTGLRGAATTGRRGEGRAAGEAAREEWRAGRGSGGTQGRRGGARQGARGRMGKSAATGSRRGKNIRVSDYPSVFGYPRVSVSGIDFDPN